MEEPTRERTGTLNARLYALLLAAYPAGFRRAYGREMRLVFADRCRERAAGRGALLGLWREALLDLGRAALRERLASLSEGGRLMKTLRTVVLAALAYAFTLFVVAPLYVGNTGRLPAFVCYLVDALIFTGLVFNFIFLLLTLTRWRAGVRAVRASLALTAVVVAVLLAAMSLDARHPSNLNLWAITAQALSLLVWHTLHLWWVLRGKPAAPPSTV